MRANLRAAKNSASCGVSLFCRSNSSMAFSMLDAGTCFCMSFAMMAFFDFPARLREVTMPRTYPLSSSSPWSRKSAVTLSRRVRHCS